MALPDIVIDGLLLQVGGKQSFSVTWLSQFQLENYSKGLRRKETAVAAILWISVTAKEAMF